MYEPVPAQVDLPALDHEVLRFWRANDVFARSLEHADERPQWIFYEGPPTANGVPGVHHVEARVFKDVFPRYRTMKGFHVPRKAGWDCHGLPVELAVEKELGFTGKRDIEAYGIAAFNDRCRESVTRHTDAFAELTERMGYWVDIHDAYRTMDPEYVESVWWSLKQIFDRGLLVEDFRVAPWCPRDETTLSDHELAQGYEDVTDPSVYVRLPLATGPNAALLVWTTTPWTLVSNTAVAVHPDVAYVVATDGTERLVVAAERVEEALGPQWTVEETFSGREMERWTYRRPFDLVDMPGAHLVVLADYVTTDSGTGLVHQAPAFGPDDLATCRAYGLPMVNPVRPDGTFAADLALVGGQFFKDADAALVADLRERGLLFREKPYEHKYPHCWRCHTPLIYYAQPSWYVRTTAIRDQLLRENERTTWQPETIKHGRYGDWLTNNVDWALSRARYWGTPLPIWRCVEGHLTCVESLADLGRKAGRDLSGLDPHRPFVDAVTFACHCGATAVRVPEVVDAWYDSGAMPFAQFGYPHRNKDLFERRYPAQFICEGIDQTRGWFYTLMTVGTLVFGRSAYENVVCLGLILAEDGRKMSKHLGNVVAPIPLLDRHGADAVRWYMAASGSPWSARRVGDAALHEVVRQTLLTYWNTVAFQSLYGRAANWTPSTVDRRHVLDRWLLSELNVLVRRVDDAMAVFDTQEAGRLLATFVDDLSNWYVRRGRRRFWRGDPAALATLHDALRTVTLLLAPIVPFVTERVWRSLVVAVDPDAVDSVHLATYPSADEALIDPVLAERVALARRLVELGRTARAGSGIRTRQPLARALASAPGLASLGPDLLAEIAAELNVVDVVVAGGESLVDTTAKANFRTLGRRFGKRVQSVARAIADADAASLKNELTGGAATVTVDGEKIILDADDVIVTETPREGWAVAADAGASLALDLRLTPELRRAGLAREVIRLIQDARRSTGLDVTDRIDLRYETSDAEVAEALTEHGDRVAEDVLATTFGSGGPGWPARPYHDADLRLTFWLRRA
ncbi:isoleucine--tRNA ligase [Virgisporangium aurantiacum]|uniref:Isoleucine--tRNA ligase n=1 Tax=Virgisporangium aurantiacum TaxID=175570 RepID=A0A8J3ZGA5_9ACTN|nr:isoleucine--tRNA ligase [Virgisporangium aurantiacum]GIJ61070.1 isoleucine--tRNA ligase [Virgisporangium aurantiacum]